MTPFSLTSGFSDEAAFVCKQAGSEFHRWQKTNALGSGGALDQELGSVWEDCRVPNWDGFHATAVDQDTLRNAYRLLEAMPIGFPPPSIGAEPDGAITLEWHRRNRRTLSVSVDGDGNLHYAALLGPNRKFGTEAFFGQFPEVIQGLIAEVYSA